MRVLLNWWWNERREVAKANITATTDPVRGEKRESIIKNEKRRHWSLGAWLILNLFGGAAYGLGGRSLREFVYPNLAQSVNLLFLAVAVANFVCVSALVKWKKWGFWGTLLVNALALILSFAWVGIVSAVLAAINVAILCLVLQFGKENKGWPQLE